MKQPRLMSLIEAIVSILVGFGLAIVCQAIVLPLLGVDVPWRANLLFAIFMTGVSIVRQFCLRRLFEALHIRRPLSPFMQAVIAERYRQVDVEGWSFEHDDAHALGDLARAGAAYALYAPWHVSDENKKSSGIFVAALKAWPWANEWWKPRDFRRDLIRGAALVLAEGERFDRLKTRKSAA